MAANANIAARIITASLSLPDITPREPCYSCKNDGPSYASRFLRYAGSHWYNPFLWEVGAYHDQLPIRSDRGRLCRVLHLSLSTVQRPASASQIFFKSRAVACAAEFPVHLFHERPAGCRVRAAVRPRPRDDQAELRSHSQRSQGAA